VTLGEFLASFGTPPQHPDYQVFVFDPEAKAEEEKLVPIREVHFDHLEQQVVIAAGWEPEV
jgi:hypothetical protein